MTTNLTPTGWTDENGTLLGSWTNGRDIVTDDTIINVAQDLTVNTKGGNDILVNTGESDSFSIGSNSRLNTGNGNDVISSSGFVGIDLSFNAVLNTGRGNDTISGNGFDGLFLSTSSTIITGQGNDNIVGEGFAVGINSRGTIVTGQGKDTVSGVATGDGSDPFIGSTGISNFEGTINTGSGDDTIIASGQVLGLSNRSGTINTGAGNDVIDASTGGFADDDGSGRINLGAGNDVIRGFGNHRGNVNGGNGYDVAELGFDYDETLLTFGSANQNSIEISFNSETVSYSNIEAFDFNGQAFSLEQLLDKV